MAKKKSGDLYDEGRGNEGRLSELLARIPTADLVSFIARSGIDREDARELCDLVRALKA
jgi:hypothetical protein